MLKELILSFGNFNTDYGKVILSRPIEFITHLIVSSVYTEGTKDMVHCSTKFGPDILSIASPFFDQLTSQGIQVMNSDGTKFVIPCPPL